jgi:thioredoxin reductase (NADPH)
LTVEFNSTIEEIKDNRVILQKSGETITIPNDLVYIFAGGELPTQFLEKAGIEITKRFGYTLKTHH